MKRRDFCKSSMVAAGLALSGTKLPAENPAETFPKAPGLTRYVSEFIVNTRYEDIPQDVMALGKKSILDGFGLALAGSVSTLAPLMKQYMETLGLCAAKSSIIGTAQKISPRFAAFANGAFIHADDYDDTQLAVAKDRVYGLLTHPTSNDASGVHTARCGYRARWGLRRKHAVRAWGCDGRAHDQNHQIRL